MRQRHGRDRKLEICSLRHRLRETVGAANEKNHGLYRLVLGATDPGRKLSTAQSAPLDFQRHHSRPLWNGTHQAVGHDIVFPVSDLYLFELRVPVDTRIVIAEQRPQISILCLSDGDDPYAHDSEVYGKTNPSSAC